MLIKTEQEEIQQYLFDVSNNYGKADEVIIPEDSSELIIAVRECIAQNKKITISGAGTGTTAGRVPNEGSVISTERLTNIIAFNSDKNTFIVQPGITVRSIYANASEKELMYVSNPTEIDCTIGGNVATNASGSRSFKYGATRNYVTALKLVLPDGEILDIKRGEIFANQFKLEIESNSGKKYSIKLPEIQMPSVKHAAGYYIKENMDAIDLFIGSEGTLGVVTEVELQMLGSPKNLLGAIVYFDDDSKMLEFTDYVRTFSKNRFAGKSDSILEARLIEYFDKYSLNMIRTKYPNIPDNANSAIWLEQEIFEDNEDVLLEKWNELIYKYSDLYVHTWIALDEQEHQRMFEFRHTLPLMIYDNISGYTFSKIGSDTAVPVEHFRAYYSFINSLLETSGLKYVKFGHIGDCHLHCNIFAVNDIEFKKAMEIFNSLVDKALEMKGTVSAEHGIGKIKKKYLLKMYGSEAIAEFKKIKEIFDPNYILGVGTMFD